MKHITITLSLMAVTALMLTGCMGGKAEPSPSPSPSPSPTPSVRPVTPDDSFQGGGAGGTNDTDYDGHPDSSATPSDSLLDDMGDAAGDMMEGAGNALDDAASGVGDALQDTGNAPDNARRRSTPQKN